MPRIWLIVESKKYQPFPISSRLEKELHLCFYRLFRALFFPDLPGFLKNEKATKIAPVFFHNPFCLMLTALVIGSEQMECAIEAAVQVRSATGTNLPPA